MIGKALRAVGFALLVALACVGCSGDDEEEEPIESGTCNGATGFSATCTEIEGDPSLIEGERQLCAEDGDVWTTEPCPTTDLLGCCRSSLGNDQYLECYYPGYHLTAEELEDQCVGFEGTWTAGSRG